MRTWIISDTHFHHAKIIEYCDRPFKDVNHMNEAMIERWNEVVGEGDVVWHLGDFGFFKDVNHMRLTTDRLNGKKNIILGNHDRFKPTQFMEGGFQWASRFPIIFDEFFILSHEPKFLESNSPYFVFYGHFHQKFYVDAKSLNYWNCCAEVQDYRPIDFDDLRERARRGALQLQ